MSHAGITNAQAEIVRRLGLTIKYVDEFLRGSGMGSGRIVEVSRNHASIQPLSNKAQPVRVPLSRIKISSLDLPAVTAEYNRSITAAEAVATLRSQATPEARNTPHTIVQVEKPMPPEAAPRPLPKAQPLDQDSPGGTFMALAARMDLAARRVEEREKEVASARRDLKAAEDMTNEAERGLSDAKKELARIGQEFSDKYRGMVSLNGT